MKTWFCLGPPSLVGFFHFFFNVGVSSYSVHLILMDKFILMILSEMVSLLHLYEMSKDDDSFLFFFLFLTTVQKEGPDWCKPMLENSNSKRFVKSLFCCQYQLYGAWLLVCHRHVFIHTYLFSLSLHISQPGLWSQNTCEAAAANGTTHWLPGHCWLLEISYRSGWRGQLEEGCFRWFVVT